MTPQSLLALTKTVQTATSSKKFVMAMLLARVTTLGTLRPIQIPPTALHLRCPIINQSMMRWIGWRMIEVCHIRRVIAILQQLPATLQPPTPTSCHNASKSTETRKIHFKPDIYLIVALAHEYLPEQL